MWNFYDRFGHKRSDYPYSVRLSQTVATNVNGTTVLSFDTEDWDVANWHSTVTNPSRITPNIAGLIRIYATVSFANPAEAGQWVCSIRKNGTTFLTAGGTGLSAAPSNALIASCSIDDRANGSTDYYEMLANQSHTPSGGAANTIAPTLFGATYVVF